MSCSVQITFAELGDLRSTFKEYLSCILCRFIQLGFCALRALSKALSAKLHLAFILADPCKREPTRQLIASIRSCPAYILHPPPCDLTHTTHPTPRATVTSADLPAVPLACPVRFVGSAIAASSRPFTVELRLDDPPPFIKPAMIANIELVQAALEDVLVVPQSAVSRVEHGFQVFVARDAEEASLRAAARTVELGVSQANQVVITAGLEAGERVIVNGKVDDHDRIRVATAAPAATRGAALAGGAPAAGAGPATPGEQP